MVQAADEVAAPESVITSGELAASELMVIVPEAAPATVGLKTTPIVQVALTASVEPQVPPESEKPDPEITMLEIFKVAAPVFVRLMVCNEVVDPVLRTPNVRA